VRMVHVRLLRCSDEGLEGGGGGRGPLIRVMCESGLVARLAEHAVRLPVGARADAQHDRRQAAGGGRRTRGSGWGERRVWLEAAAEVYALLLALVPAPHPRRGGPGGSEWARVRAELEREWGDGEALARCADQVARPSRTGEGMCCVP
jgi:hypothetical protein